MRAEVINNVNDPVTNVLTNPFSLVSLAWGTAASRASDRRFRGARPSTWRGR